MVAHIHPEDSSKVQTVQEHMEGTAKIAEQYGKTLGMGCISYLAGLFHDLGKWRKEFEDYIRACVNGQKEKTKGSVNHSSAGAIYIYRKYYQGSSMQKLTAQLICEAILSHHGLNDCMSPKGEDCFRKRVEDLEHLDYEEVIHNFENSTISKDKIEAYFMQAVEEVSCLQQLILDNGLSDAFTKGLIARMLMSIVIDADRLDTAVFCGDRSIATQKISGDQKWEDLGQNLEKKLNSFPKKEGIFALRRQIADECLEFATRPPGIYRLAVPTGGSKTLSSMRYAINHAKTYHKKRIFYIGPYLSILEQNSQVFREALGNTDLILEHHSNVIPEESDEEEYCINRYRHLTENWEIPIVITTFVQFLDTLFAGRTSSVRRFHNLSNSVIIIDEIQSLPIQMIHIFNMAMNYLFHMCGATIILCSATQPILEKVPMPIHMSVPSDIIADTDSLYKRLKRVRIEERKGNLSTDELCSFVGELMEKNRDILIILNTKGAVRKAFLALQDYIQGKDIPVTIVHLSTSMCPEHRINCINQMKNRKENEHFLCISTSLIEAGVDLSFSCVIRSFAGLDKIAQAAGRCNRNGELEEGVVYLIHYKEEYLGTMEQIRKGAMCSEVVVDQFNLNKQEFQNDLLSIPALNAFYERYYYDKEQKDQMNYRLEELNTCLVDLLSANLAGKKAYFGRTKNTTKPDLALFQAFKTAGEHFEVIDQDTVGVLVPYEEGSYIINMLNGELSAEQVIRLLRKAQRFTVALYRNEYQELCQSGAIITLNNGKIPALAAGFYDQHLGVKKEGRLEFLDI